MIPQTTSMGRTRSFSQERTGKDAAKNLCRSIHIWEGRGSNRRSEDPGEFRIRSRRSPGYYEGRGRFLPQKASCHLSRNLPAQNSRAHQDGDGFACPFRSILDWWSQFSNSLEPRRIFDDRKPLRIESVGASPRNSTHQDSFHPKISKISKNFYWLSGQLIYN